MRKSRRRTRRSGAIRRRSSVAKVVDARVQAVYADVIAATVEAMAAPRAVRRRKIRGIRDRISRGAYSPTAAAIARRLVGV